MNDPKFWLRIYNHQTKGGGAVSLGPFEMNAEDIQTCTYFADRMPYQLIGVPTMEERDLIVKTCMTAPPERIRQMWEDLAPRAASGDAVVIGDSIDKAGRNRGRNINRDQKDESNVSGNTEFTVTESAILRVAARHIEATASRFNDAKFCAFIRHEMNDKEFLAAVLPYLSQSVRKRIRVQR